MKKLSVLSAVFCLFLAAGAVFAQDKEDNFAGRWELDVNKSKLAERMRVESMTLNVAQSDQEIRVKTAVKRAARPESENRGGKGSMRPGGGMAGGDGTVIYSLVGGARTGTVVKPENALDTSQTTTKPIAALENDGKLKLNSTRKTNTEMGEFAVKTQEVWELIDGGRGLRITRETETPRGSQSSEMYFTRKVSSENKSNSADVSGSEIITPSSDSAGGTSLTPKTISKGVLNGTALTLTLPAYPAEARETKAGGGVNVQVTIDEQGNVVSAKAISGDPLLKAASEEAARNSKFAPTTLQGVPVKVTGVIYYNFVP
jgi:TonB family protein